MNIDALGPLKRRSEETSTTGLVICRDGKEILSYGKNKKVPLYSLTKTIVSLAIGFLFDEGKIESLDTPVSRWFTDWQDGPKSRITVRMLLTHTSGIEDHFIDMDGSFNLDKLNAFRKVQNVIEAAIKLNVVKEPGKHPSYSNSSTDILVALVNKISKMRIDQYVDEKLFKPLGITDWEWVSSTKQLFGTNDNTPSGAAGLVMTAKDLAKVGQLILQNGIYVDKKILSSEWIKLMSSEIPTPALSISFGDSALTNIKDNEQPDKYLPATDNGHPIPLERYSSGLLCLVPQSLASKKSGEVLMGWGFLGQYLMIMPEKNLIAVRLYTEGLPDFGAHEENARVSFADFEYWVRKIK